MSFGSKGHQIDLEFEMSQKRRTWIMSRKENDDMHSILLGRSDPKAHDASRMDTGYGGYMDMDDVFGT